MNPTIMMDGFVERKKGWTVGYSTNILTEEDKKGIKNCFYYLLIIES